jgi:ABC-type transport system involved in multi-copper enzyme maturation permease subunit
MPYIGSKVLVAFLFALYHAGAMFAIKALHFDFPDQSGVAYAQIYVTLVLAVMSGVMWGLLISAITSREEQAMMLAIGIIVLQVVFSGGIVSLKDLGIVGTVLGGITSTHWAFRGVTSAVGLSLDGCEQGNLADCRLPGFGAFPAGSGEANLAFSSTYDKFGGIFGAEVWMTWVAMGIILLALGAILFALQKRKDTL